MSITNRRQFLSHTSKVMFFSLIGSSASTLLASALLGKEKGSNMLRLQVNSDAVKTAGELDYIYAIGEELNLFKVTEMVLQLQKQGDLPISKGGSAEAVIGNYLKIKDRYPSKQETRALYKKILNRGGAVAGIRGNTAFSELWSELIEKGTELKNLQDAKIKKLNFETLFETVYSLQVNLAKATKQIDIVKIQQINQHLLACITVLNDPEINKTMGSPFIPNVWMVLEHVSRTYLQKMPDIKSWKRLGRMGNDVYSFLAEPIPENVSKKDEKLNDFLRASAVYSNTLKTLD